MVCLRYGWVQTASGTLGDCVRSKHLRLWENKQVTTYFPPVRLYTKDNTSTVKYMAASPTAQDRGDGAGMVHPYAEMFVAHTPESYHTIWSDEEPHGYNPQYLSQLYEHGNFDVTPLLTAGAENYPERYAANVERFKQTPAGSPDTLFAHFPARHVITDAFSDPSMTHTIPMLGAMAHMKASETDKSPVLTVSGSLSRHSAPLAQNAIQKGLPVQTHPFNTQAQQNNMSDFQPLGIGTHLYESKMENSNPLNEQQVGEVRAHLRSMLRPARNKTTPVNTPKFRQPTLPGF